MTDAEKWVWIPDEKLSFVKAMILDEKDDTFNVRVKDTGETKTVAASQVEKVNPSQFNKVGDMAELTYLNEPSVIHNLSSRWHDGQIYTYSGLFLVAVNPYRPLEIYGDKIISEYKGKRKADAEPHIYAIAEEAFRSMLETKRDQSILITGESGAGKTENTKKAIQYLSSITKGGDASGGIDARIIQTNPILEAFGNAQTIRNSNSSRFGKFIKIQFANESNRITGASIQWYLMEKSRVVTQHAEERNYHVFYQLLKGAPADLKRRLQLPEDANPREFTYLASGTPTIEGVDDSQLYTRLVDAFRIMGFPNTEVEAIMKMVASVLLLGQIKFRATSADQGSVVDHSAVERVSTLLGVNADTFIQSILQPRVKIGREYTTQSRNSAQAQHTTNAVAKALYERLFGYIVEQLNSRLGKENASACCIGVLDIAGFEIFEQNSFEQLCINYTNEKLQQFFNHHMFVLEQEEYVKENVDWDYVDYGADLQPTIDLIEQAKNPMGIFSCLNEESVLPSGSDDSFNEKLIKQWEGKNTKFTPSRLGQGFKIDHYAQTVEYQIDGWIEKNKDPLSDAVEAVLSESSNTLVKTLFANNESSKLKGKANLYRTVAQRHKEQLASLMIHLEATQPHFVRCIIPNTHRSPSAFDNHLVLDQLRYNGVLEGIRIARSGYPNRLEFAEFCKRYKALAGTIKGQMDSQQTCATLLQRINLDPAEYKVGMSKVFFRNGVLAKLEHSLDKLVAEQALLIQSLSRGAIVRIAAKRELHRRRAAKVIATCFKLNIRYSKDPWWQFNSGLKPLLMSKESMDSSKKDLRMQKLENALHRLKEEQVELISSKNELRGELIASLHAKEEISKSLANALKEQKERDETHELAASAARSRDEASTAALRELSERHSSLRAELEEARTRNETMDKELKKGTQEMVDKLKQELEESKAQRAKAEMERDFSDSRIKDISSKHEDFVKKLKTELDHARKDFGNKIAELDLVKAELKQAKDQSQALDSKSNDMVKAKDQEIETLKSQLETATSEVKTLKEKHLQELSQAQADLKSTRTKHDDLEKLHGMKLKELTSANTEANTLGQKLEATNKEVSKLRDWLSKAKNELKSAAQTVKDYTELQDTHKVFVEKANEKHAKLEKELEQSRSSTSNLQEQLSNSAKIDELQSVKNENRKLTKDVDIATENYLKTNEELIKVKRSLEEKEQKLSAVQSKLSSTSGLLEEHKSAAESLKTDLSKSTSKIETLETSNTSLKSKLQELEKDIATKTELTASLTQEKSRLETDLAAAKEKVTELNAVLTSRSVSNNSTSVSANFDVNRRLAATRKELAETQKALLRLQTQSPPPGVPTSPFAKRFGNEDAEQELAVTKHELAQAEAHVKELESELESVRKENAEGIILRQKYENLQREKAMLAQDRSHLMLGVKSNVSQSRELEITKARAAEVKRLQSEVNVLKLKLLRSEKDRKSLEDKSNEPSASESRDIESLRHRLRLAEIAKLQLSKTVHELSKRRSLGIATDAPDSPVEVGEPLDPNDPPLAVAKRDVPHALRNISNDRRVSEHAHMAAEHIKSLDLQEALDIYKTRAKDFHAKLEKAELVVESAVRAEKLAKEQVEEYKNRLERIEDDHNSEISHLRRKMLKSQNELDSRDAQIEELIIKANFSDELQSQIKSMNITLMELSTERDRLAKDKVKLEKRLHEVVSSFDHQPRQLQEQFTAMKQNEQHMLREHSELRWKLERKSRLVDQLRRSLTDADNRIEQCRSDIDRLQANESVREIALRRANREVSETNEKYLMAERELEQYRLSRQRSSAATQPARDMRPAFV